MFSKKFKKDYEKWFITRKDFMKLYSYSLRGEILYKSLKEHLNNWQEDINISKKEVLTDISEIIFDTDKIIEEFKEE
jgi:hypothetical protein